MIKISSIGASRHEENIDSMIFYQFIVNFTYLSGFISILSIYHQYTAIFWVIKRWSMRQQTYAIKLLKMASNFCHGVVVSQPLEQVYLFIYNLHQIYINSNLSYKHNFFLKIYFKKQINYNYFIIKQKISSI